MDPKNTNYELEPAGGPRRSQAMPWWPAVLVIILVALGIGWFLWSRSKARELPMAETAEAPASEPTEVPQAVSAVPEVWELPPLEESDDFLRDVAATLSGHSAWLSWLATDDLVRRFVAAVDEVARGELPASQARFLVPKKGFAATSEAGRLVLGAESQGRFNRVAAVVSGLDADGVASLYGRLRPLFRDAYRDLGYPRADFDDVLAKAMRKVLAAPDLDDSAELVAAVRSYKYADPRLEALPAVQKLMLRLGPANARLVKAKLHEIAAALDQARIAARTAPEGAAQPETGVATETRE